MSIEMKNSHVGVVGLGRYGGGLGLTRHLLKKGYFVHLFDLLPEEELQDSLKELEPWKESLRCTFGQHDIEDFDGLAMCYLNPAVPWEGKLANGLRQIGMDLSSDIECFLKDWKRPVIGLTGSNGKSTCWEMIARLLPEWSHGGNRGVSVFDMPQNKEGCLLELSSFQLERIEYCFPISVVTTFTPDHLDQHGSMVCYRQAKERVSAFQGKEDLCVLGRGLEDWSSYAKKLVLGRDFDYEGNALTFEDATFEVSPFPLHGPHNKDLLALAIATVRRVLNDDQELQARIDVLCQEGMSPLPHRQNIICESPYRVVNDSKATTPESTICAIRAFDKEGATLHLICGGKEKELEIGGVLEEVAVSHCELYVIGEQTARYQSKASQRGLTFNDCGDLKNAMALIQKNIKEGDTVLLSPGTSSFDQYRHYKERGEVFCDLAKNIFN